jgi:hypothetical protein
MPVWLNLLLPRHSTITYATIAGSVISTRKLIVCPVSIREIETSENGAAGTAALNRCDRLSRIIRVDLSHLYKSAVPSVPNLACSDLEAPAFAVFAGQILVGVGHVSDLALFAVVVDALALSGFHGHDA